MIVQVRVIEPHFTLIVPERIEVPVFSASLYFTVPLPLPDAPEAIVIHDALAVAVHELLQATENDSAVFASQEYARDIASLPPPIVRDCDEESIQ